MTDINKALDQTGRAVFSNGTVDAIVEDGPYGHVWLHNHEEQRIYSGDLKAAPALLKDQGVPLQVGWIAQNKRHP